MQRLNAFLDVLDMYPGFQVEMNSYQDEKTSIQLSMIPKLTESL